MHRRALIPIVLRSACCAALGACFAMGCGSSKHTASGDAGTPSGTGGKHGSGGARADAGSHPDGSAGSGGSAPGSAGKTSNAGAGTQATGGAGKASNADAGRPSSEVATTKDPWVPPMLAGGSAMWSGEIGWRKSDAAICSAQRGGVAAHAIWSNADAVYALMSTRCNEFADNCTGDSGTAVYWNDGSAWTRMSESSVPEDASLTGFPDGRLLVFGSGGTCGVQLIDGTNTECLVMEPVVDLFVVDDRLAYALEYNRVLRFDGERFAAFGAAFEPADAVDARAIWADQKSIVVVGQKQLVLAARADDATFTPLSKAPAGDYISVWAYAADDVFTGNSLGQLYHYDGADWQLLHETGACAGDGITAIWGAIDRSVFFITATRLSKWNGQAVESVADFGCEPSVRLDDLWGNSNREVFLSVIDIRETDRACGQTPTLWYDGTSLREL